MPTVLRVGPYRFFFYSGDRAEPAHIHVERDGSIAKFWLTPVRLESSRGFSRPELRQIGDIVADHAVQLKECWDDFFGV